MLIPFDEAARAEIASSLTTYKDWPKPPINFVDVFSLWQKPDSVKAVVRGMAEAIRAQFPAATHLLGLESRGFLFGTLLAAELSLPFVPVRKAGKLPGDCAAQKYDLEYGSATIEIQRSALNAASKVVLIDDLLATGGTLAAAASLARSLGADVQGAMVMIELEFLHGAAKVGAPVLTLLKGD